MVLALLLAVANASLHFGSEGERELIEMGSWANWGAMGANALRLLALLGLLFGMFPAQASEAGNGARTRLAVCIAPLTDDDRPSDLFSGKTAVDCAGNQTRFGEGSFWALSEPVGADGENHIDSALNLYALRSSGIWQSARTVFVRYEDGYVYAARQDARQAGRTMQIGPDFLDLIPNRSSPIDRILWRIEGAPNIRGVLIEPVLMSLNESHAENLKLTMLYAAFFGVIFALAVHHMTLWTVMRQPYQLAYTGLLIVLMIYSLTSSGVILDLIPSLDSNDRVRLNVIGIGLFSCTSLHFARLFFDDSPIPKNVHRLADFSILLVMTLCLAMAFLAPLEFRLMARLLGTGFLILCTAAAAVLWSAWRQKNRYFTMFLFAWSLVFVSTFFRVSDILTLKPLTQWVDNSTVIAMAFEALISSVGIAHRIRLINFERDRARQLEQAAMNLADRDPLTNLLNRRAFLRQAIGRAGPQQLFLIDIDYFRRLNESVGHDGADDILVAVSRAIEAVAPSEALVARLGGDEFALLCPVEADLAADTILRKIRSLNTTTGAVVSASIGTCIGSTFSEDDWRELYRTADLALFDAKSAGRSRSHHFNKGMPAIAIPQPAGAELRVQRPRSAAD
jgi:diguanylate cyclase (GGDEF)-like protein